MLSVINTATNTAEGAVYVGKGPYSLGQFIQPDGYVVLGAETKAP